MFSMGRMRIVVTTFMAAFCLSTASFAQDLTTLSDPASLGFSVARLDRIRKWYQPHVEAGDLLGSVVAIARDGRLVSLQAVGFEDRAKAIPMRSDSIGWLGFMTEPITAVAALALVEDGKLELDAPVARYLPELKDMQVSVANGDDSPPKNDAALQPQKQAMTVRDLLRHTDGIAYHDPAAPMKPFYAAAGVDQDKPMPYFMAELAKLPLAHQPSEAWTFSLSYDVLARVIEIASGQPFDQYLQGRVLKPLRMVDTDFDVPIPKLSRFAEPAIPGRHLFLIGNRRRFFSGSRGLVSTAADFLRFCQMLLNGGELDGVRVLSRQSVQLMTSNALPPSVHFGDFFGQPGGEGFGFGLEIRTDPESSAVPGSVGSYSRIGGWGTAFWVDPAQRLIAVHMNQAANTNVSIADIRNLTYGALSVPPPAASPASSAPATGAIGASLDYAGRYDFGTSPSSSDKIVASVNNFGGIGINLVLTGNAARVAATKWDSPAVRAGLMRGDLITQIDDTPVKALPRDQVSEKIRGPINSQVRLKVSRKGQHRPIELTITREQMYTPANELRVRVDGGALVAEASGRWSILDFEKGKPVTLSASSDREFYVPDGDHTRIAFVRGSEGKVTGAVLNPGPFEQRGVLVAGDAH
jgi:CubicO group peptidase (beta-lactamase class C family)